MKFATFQKNGLAIPGVLIAEDTQIADISQLVPGIGSLSAVIEGGASVLDAIRQGSKNLSREIVSPLASVRLSAPIPQPRRNIFCVGKNYHEHAQEFHDSGFDASSGGQAVPDFPIFFSKSHTTIIGPNEPIPASADWTNSVDYEVELALVIGKGGRAISKADAYDHVFGYTIINDVTSRTLQQQHKQWFLGKNFDGFCPMGPWLVTADEAGTVDSLVVRTSVNGEVRQGANIKDLIFDIPTLINILSAVTTLQPGDIIATGTPAGVGIGFDPPRFLQPGDSVSLEITNLGVLTNPVE